MDNTEPHLRGTIRTLLQMAIVLTYGTELPVVKVGRIAGSVREAALVGLRRGRAAVLPRRHGQRAGGDGGGSPARSGAARARVRQRRRGDEPDARDHRRGHGRPARPARVEHGLRAQVQRRAALRARRAARSTGRCGSCPPAGSTTPRCAPSTCTSRTRCSCSTTSARCCGSTTTSSTCCPRTRCGSGTARASSTARTSALAALLANPIGVKIGPSTTPEMAVDLVKRDRPEPRRRARDARLADGLDKVRDLLPPIVEAVQALRPPRRVAVRPDARQHRGVAERPQDAPLRPHPRRGPRLLRGAPRRGTYPGGIHVEHSGEDVTECLGGAQMIDHDQLGSRYETACDPRLNTQQSLELAVPRGRHAAPQRQALSAKSAARAAV